MLKGIEGEGRRRGGAGTAAAEDGGGHQPGSRSTRDEVNPEAAAVRL